MNRARQAVQVLSLAFFMYLFLLTIYPFAFESSIPVELYLRLDPLLALSTVLASRTFIALFVFSVIFIGIAILAGRLFCGWLCPLGAILDIFDRAFFVRHYRSRELEPKLGELRRLKYVLLISIIVLAVFGVQLAGWFDPISLLTRTLTVVVYHFAGEMSFRIFEDPANMFFTGDYLPHGPIDFTLQEFFLVIMLLVLFSQFLQSRFWCRNLCPLGALYGIIGKWKLLRLEIDSSCRKCGICARVCKTGAIAENEIVQDECITCFNCVRKCPHRSIKTLFALPRRRDKARDVKTGKTLITRRESIAAIAGAAAAVPLMKLSASGYFMHPQLIRPPGVTDEDDFKAKCVRCGQCIKVCETNVLHPALFESGLSGMFTPRLVPEIGYCRQRCTMCGDVCASGAIPKLNEEEKIKFVMGVAIFNEDSCIPYKEKDNCMVCEEMCPIYEKAIRFVEKEELAKNGEPLLVPYVVEELCTGCGICVTKCPLEGRRGIEIWRSPGK